MAYPIVGDGCAGPPSLHMRSFLDWHARLSASRISTSPARRFSSARLARIPVMARALLNSLSRALRSPPDSDVGWCFGAVPPSKRSQRRSTNRPRCCAWNRGKPLCFAGVDNDCHMRLAWAHDFAPCHGCLHRVTRRRYPERHTEQLN
jgi:hypothetical protein